jgi:hypothetical protein
LDGFSEEEWSKIDVAFQQAKEMFEEQIVSSYRIGRVEQTIPTEKFRTGNQHYKETYGGNK